jgi:iron complex outermembrane recepter protein
VKAKMKPLNRQRRMAFVKKPCAVATGIAMSLMGGHLAHAQEATQVEKIEVTGTRLPPKNLEASAPVTIITAEDIKLEGVRTMENLLNNLPQVFADQGGNLANTASGTATVNLRNLGAQRTLLLVNGRRLPPGDPNTTDPNFSAPDLNFVPAPLVARVEVLTGGASGAVYGADAVAGVVNFIMNDKFQGVQLDYNNSFFNHHQQDTQGVGDLITARAAVNPSQYQLPGDQSSIGKTNATSMLMGSNFADGRGNATVYFGYQHTDPVLQGQYDFSACTVGAASSGFSCGGSGTNSTGRFIDTGNGGVVTIANAQGGVRPFLASDQYNYGALNYYQRPDERYNFAAFAHYDVTPWARVYSEFMFMDDHTVAQVAPSGVFGVPINLNSSNPLLSAAEINQWFTMNGLVGPNQVETVIIQRRNVEGGNRQDDLRHTDFRGVVGVKGDINKTWQYDVSQQWAQVIYQETFLNDVSVRKFTNALDVVANPAGGAPVCRSVLNGTDPNCVPWNIFALGGVTPAAEAYITSQGFKKGNTTQTISLGTISGDLGDYNVRSPWAKDGVSVVFGGEYRREGLTLNTDQEYQTADLGGQSGATLPTAGQTSYKDVFTEFRVPLVEGMPWAKVLDLHGTYRYSQLEPSATSADSYSAELGWAPISQLKFRGGYARAVRAPNMQELFGPQVIQLFNNNSDPCAGAAPTATLAQCQNTGVTPAQYGHIIDNPAGQYNTLSGGNTHLLPEKGDTYTLGMVLTPFKNMSVTADYFDIRITDEIGTIPQPTTLLQCLNTGNPLYCSLIHRGTQGDIWLPASSGGGYISGQTVNIAAASQTGVDLGADYVYRMAGMGALKFDLIGTWVYKAPTTLLPGFGSFDCVGLHGTACGVPTPRWRHKAYVNWQTPWNANIRLQWRHINAVDQEGTSSNPQLNNPGLAPIDAHWSARDYIDLAGSWQITKMFSVSGGVNNLFDKDPPLAGAADLAGVVGSGNTYPNFYDSMGRYIFVNVQAKF